MYSAPQAGRNGSRPESVCRGVRPINLGTQAVPVANVRTGNVRAVQDARYYNNQVTVVVSPSVNIYELSARLKAYVNNGVKIKLVPYNQLNLI